jgi:ABC-type molybdenum transport system ATPase subunit/photorepair protein PhrA
MVGGIVFLLAILPDTCLNTIMEQTDCHISPALTANFQAIPGQSWGILGTNRSGISDLFAALSGQNADVKQGMVSFAGQQTIYESELRQDDTDFMDRPDPGTPARHFLTDIPAHEPLIRALDMLSCLNTGFRHLSSGQARKLMILSCITRGATRLMIQAPCDGLDAPGCRELNRALSQLHHQGIPILLFVHNPEDIPDWITHIGTGDHTLITGPNGSGKSTLIQVITGDHGACYQNDLTLFGIPRGSGESIWDIRHPMGIVSPELHRAAGSSGSHCRRTVKYDSVCQSSHR